MAEHDPFMLSRFVDAQEGVYDAALAELSAGAKRSHWMWFVFPQIAGLGSSPMARRYAIASLAEARAYAAHDVLGQRLHQATRAALDAPTRDARALFGTPDDMKFRSSMTLFAEAEPASALFRDAIARFYAGPDERTLVILSAQESDNR